MTDIKVILLQEYTLVRDLLADYLRSLSGVRLIDSVGTIAEAYATSLREPPDLLIIDWHLPDGSGIDLSISIRNSLPQTRILMVSANEQEGLIRDAAGCGIHGFISKRQPRNSLADAINAMRAGQCYFCPTSNRLLLEAMSQPQQQATTNLTPREREVLRALASGLSTKDIASSLKLSPKTVANQITLIKGKLGIHESSGLVRYALRHGMARLN